MKIKKTDSFYVSVISFYFFAVAMYSHSNLNFSDHCRNLVCILWNLPHSWICRSCASFYLKSSFAIDGGLKEWGRGLEILAFSRMVSFSHPLIIVVKSAILDFCHWISLSSTKGSKRSLFNFIGWGFVGSWGELPSSVFSSSELTFSPNFVLLIASKALALIFSPCFFLVLFFSTFSPSFAFAFSFSSQAVLCFIQMFFLIFLSSSLRMNLSISSESI